MTEAKAARNQKVVAFGYHIVTLGKSEHDSVSLAWKTAMLKQQQLLEIEEEDVRRAMMGFFKGGLS